MTSKAEEILLKAKAKEQNNSKSKEYSRASEWPKCCKSGCPLWATIKADRPTCGYHFRSEGHEADSITEAVKENVAYINKWKEMSRWNVKQWKEKRHQIMGWPVLPATEKEMDLPSLYLSRFYKWIETTINERASEIYQGR